ncbi:MAG: TetR/AcrR family transcriptional regulator [Desulfosarcinaceae bacterium]|nr:TetR/AcrR family transcriptional regulator [Desulfosarcinaceae bacterium]
MRTKDDDKIAALFGATVKLVNEIGFAASSVSKIAKEAKVSPATLYVYYENKEALLVSTYVEIKRELSQVVLRDFDEGRPIRDTLQIVWRNLFEHISNHLDYFRYMEQFSNSPYTDQVDHARLERFFEPLAQVIQRGIAEKIIKDVDRDILKVFIWHPVMVLANPRLCQGFEMTDKNIEDAFTMAWDAIKL